MPGQKIVVIGDEDAVFGLGLIGLEGHAVSSVEQAREAIQKAIADSNHRTDPAHRKLVRSHAPNRWMHRRTQRALWLSRSQAPDPRSHPWRWRRGSSRLWAFIWSTEWQQSSEIRKRWPRKSASARIIAR